MLGRPLWPKASSGWPRGPCTAVPQAWNALALELHVASHGWLWAPATSKTKRRHLREASEHSVGISLPPPPLLYLTTLLLCSLGVLLSSPVTL